MASSVPGMFPIPISPDGPLSPAAGPFIGPVEIRGKKIKKYIFLFSLLSTGGLNFVPKG